MSNMPIFTLLGSCALITAQKGYFDETCVPCLRTHIQKAQPELEEAGITGVVSRVFFVSKQKNS